MNIPFPLQPLQTLEYGRSGQIDFRRELLGGQARVVLQESQKFEIGLVKGGNAHGIIFF